MMQPDFTARNVAKWIVTSVVAMKTTQMAAETAEEYTNFEKDDMIVQIGAGVLGWGVSAKLKPYTDKVVDKSADFIVEKWEQRQKKNDKKDEDK